MVETICVHKDRPAPNGVRVGAGFASDLNQSASVKGDYLEVDAETYFKLVEKHRVRGVGDMVESVAKPIARAIDAAIGTNLANCGGCEKRKQWLNSTFG